MYSSPLKLRTAMLTLALSGYALPLFAQTPAPSATYAVVDMADYFDFVIEDKYPYDVDNVYGTADDLNDEGKLVGSISGETFATEGFVSQSGVLTRIAPLNSERLSSTATALSGGGKISGSSVFADGNKGFVYSSGQLSEIGTGPRPNYTTGINDSGQVVGVYYPDYEARPFFYSNGQFTPIPLPTEIQLPYDSQPMPVTVQSGEAFAINNAGQMVGYVMANQGQTLGFLSDGTTTRYLQGQGSFASAINQAGVIAGRTYDNTYRATLWTDNGNTLTELPALDGEFNQSFTNDINDENQVVGMAQNSAGYTRAVLWQNGQITDLNSLIPANSGWVLAEATRINNRGEVLGRGYLNGHHRQFVLTLLANDAIAPVTQARFEGNMGGQNWFVDSGHLVLAAKDNGGTQTVVGTGVNATYYRVNGGPTRTYTEPVLFETSGTYNISYWSVDAVGNSESNRNFSFKLDNALPLVTASRVLQLPALNHKEWVLIHGKISDVHSGLDRTQATYTISDEYEQYQPTGTLTIRPNGSFDLPLSLPSRFTPSDPAGRSFQVTITGYDIAGNSGIAVVNLTTGKRGSSNSS